MHRSVEKTVDVDCSFTHNTIVAMTACSASAAAAVMPSSLVVSLWILLATTKEKMFVPMCVVVYISLFYSATSFIMHNAYFMVGMTVMLVYEVTYVS